MGIRKKCFREVSQTELFTYDGECYMRLSKVYEDIDKLYNAVNLLTGELYYFTCDVRVGSLRGCYIEAKERKSKDENQRR